MQVTSDFLIVFAFVCCIFCGFFVVGSGGFVFVLVGCFCGFFLFVILLFTSAIFSIIKKTLKTPNTTEIQDFSSILD